MKTFTLFLLVTSLLLPQYAFSCSCSGQNTFCNTITKDQSDGITIVRGTKVKDIDHGMEVEIYEVIKGNEDKKTITVWGDPGFLCRVYASNFEGDEEYIFAFHPITAEDTTATGWQALERIGHYTISVCGKYYWKVGGEPGQTETAEEIEACLKALPPDPEPIVFGLFPNPTSNLLYIQLETVPDTLYGLVSIFDDSGRRIRKYARLEEVYARGILTFELEGVSSGIYFIRMELPEIFPEPLTKKFVML